MTTINWDKEYTEIIREVLSDEQTREIYFEIADAENEWTPATEIEEANNTQEHIRKLSKSGLIERGMLNHQGENLTYFRKDELLPKHESFIENKFR
jgi:hypothetical protein